MTNRTNELLELSSLGWKLLPVGEQSKRPILKNWPALASSDEDQIIEWYDEFPQCNWGLKLGPDSGIIDIECDSEAAEAGLIELFGGNVPVTPMFEATRGMHRLFRFRDGFPPTAVIHLGPLEIRLGAGGQGAQSLIPPSVHPSGAVYKWIIHPMETPLADITDEIMTVLVGTSKSKKESSESMLDLLSGSTEGMRNESAAKVVGKLLNGMRDPFKADAVQVQWVFVSLWNEQNDPPLSREELLRVFNSILRKEREQRNKVEYAKDFEDQVALVPDNDDQQTWRLVVVTGRPKRYQLFSPLWNGHLELVSGQMVNPASIRVEALEQKGIVLEQNFRRIWLGDKGDDDACLLRRLVDASEEQEAVLEDDNRRVLALMLREQIEKAAIVREDRKPDGTVQRLEDGSIVFKFSLLLERLAMTVEKTSRGDLSALLQNLGASFYDHRRLKKLDQDAIGRLEVIINGE